MFLAPVAFDLHSRLKSLRGLPIRPRTARALLDDPAGFATLESIDPGWTLARLRDAVFEPLDLVAASPWWIAKTESGAAALDQLWKHGIAAACAARRLAAERGRTDADRLARVALLHQLGLWVLGTQDPECLASWMSQPVDPNASDGESPERSDYFELVRAGRELARRWGADPLLIDVAWLHGERTPALASLSADPASLSLIQKAHKWAERTPWALYTPRPDAATVDTRLKLLVAEVQTLSAGAFVSPGDCASEERLCRNHAALLLESRQTTGSLRALEIERDRMRAQLDAAVEAHRESLAESRAGEASRRLDALAEFAAGAGHELNNPLAVIQGRAQLLLAHTADADDRRSLRAIMTQAQRAHRMLRDLMIAARPPAPRHKLCHPDEIARACLRDVANEADARGITLQADLPATSVPLVADPDGLRALAEALVRNALEATPRGGCVVFHREPANADLLVWSVRDSGRGVGAAQAQHLFDPFYCGRQAGRGLGLGLPRAARFVSQHGGRITWRTEPGHGTVFTMTLPTPARDDAPLMRA